MAKTNQSENESTETPRKIKVMIHAKRIADIDKMLNDLIDNIDDIMSDDNDDSKATSDKPQTHDKPSIGDMVWRTDKPSAKPYIVDAIHITKDKTTLSITDANMATTEVDESLVTTETPNLAQLLDSITGITRSMYHTLEKGDTVTMEKLADMCRDIETYITLIRSKLGGYDTK